MSKPSIFSRDYKMKMKKRKRRTAFIIFFLIFLGANFYLYSKLNRNFNLFSVKNYITSIFNKKEVNKDKKQTNNDNKETNKANEEANKAIDEANKVNVEVKPEIDKVETPETLVPEEKGYSFDLSDGKKYKAIYEENNGEKKFKNVTGDNESLDFNISPAANGIVTYDPLVQSIIFMDLNGITKDISKKIHFSTDGSKFIREETIKNKTGYVWAINPKFIDNENVAYVSQLPWFKTQAAKYLWIVNIKNPDNPTLFQNISGNNIVLGKLEDKGLNIIIDGKSSFLRVNGQLISN